MKKLKILPILCIVILLGGCNSSTAKKQQQQDKRINIGNNISIDVPKQLTLLESKEALAADTLYYATWIDGNSIPYENSAGKTLDFYDAQLYFLASETSNEETAKKDCNTWLSAAKENYEVYAEETITCNGQSYVLISYNCIGDDTPYDHGISAFGVCGVNAVCVEFIYLKNYRDELKPILTEFLNGCYYKVN